MMFALTAPNGRPAPAPVLSQMERISSATGKPTEAATAAALPRAIFGRRTGQPDAVRRRDQYVESDCDQFPGGSSYELERRNVRTEPRLQLLSDPSPICSVKIDDDRPDIEGSSGDAASRDSEFRRSDRTAGDA